MSDKAIVKYVKEEGRFTFSFSLEIPDLKIDKQFNMNREITEGTGAFMGRLNNNIAKANKKKKGEGEERLKAKFAIKDSLEAIDSTLHKNVSDFLFLKNLHMTIDDRTFVVIVNPPMVTELKMSDVIMVGMHIYPHKLSLQFADEEKTEIEWFISEKLEEKEVSGAKANKKAKSDWEDGLHWKSVGRGKLYYPSVSDLQCRLRCQVTPWLGEQAGEAVSVIGTASVTLGPGICPTHSRHKWTTAPLTNPKELRMVTYNILADLYADSDYSRTDLFPQCPPYALHIDYRVKLILQELDGYHADLICLQEVDQKVFDLHLAPVLAISGFQGKFAKKRGQVTEGLAVFARKGKLEVLDFISVFVPDAMRTSEYSYMWAKVSHNPALVDTLTQRTTTLAVCVLRMAGTGDILVVGNTHLYFKPDVDHIRLLQTEVCLKELERVKTRMEVEHPDCRVSLVFCGDFNSTPSYDNHMGGVLQYVTQGRIAEDHPDWRCRPGEEVQGLTLTSSNTFISAAGTPQFTNYALGFKDCLDYIFIEEGKAAVRQVVPFPTEEELDMYKALPNIVFPSDHVAVVVDVKLTDH